MPICFPDNTTMRTRIYVAVLDKLHDIINDTTHLYRIMYHQIREVNMDVFEKQDMSLPALEYGIQSTRINTLLRYLDETNIKQLSTAYNKSIKEYADKVDGFYRRCGDPEEGADPIPTFGELYIQALKDTYELCVGLINLSNEVKGVYNKSIEASSNCFLALQPETPEDLHILQYD